MIENYILLVLLILSMVATPGPATISAFAGGVQYGFIKTSKYLAGLITGFFTLIFISHFGFMYIIMQNQIMVDAFLIFTFIYLVYLALKIWASDISKPNDVKLKFIDGFILNILNPKAYLGVMTVFTQFHEEFHPLTVSILIWFLGSSCASLYTFLGQWIGERIESHHMVLLNRILSVVLMATVIFLFI